MHRRAAQLIGRDVLAQYALDDPGTGQTEKRVFGLDEEAPLTREVTAPTGVKAKHAHDAGHDATDLAQRGESVSVAIEATDPRRYISAGRIVEADQGNMSLGGELKQARQLLAIGRIHGASANREVMAVHRHVTAVDRDNRCHE